jgi:hypothetical protein
MVASIRNPLSGKSTSKSVLYQLTILIVKLSSRRSPKNGAKAKKSSGLHGLHPESGRDFLLQADDARLELVGSPA